MQGRASRQIQAVIGSFGAKLHTAPQASTCVAPQRAAAWAHEASGTQFFFTGSPLDLPATISLYFLFVKEEEVPSNFLKDAGCPIRDIFPYQLIQENWPGKSCLA